MATKLKLGTDNNWATKVDKLLAYNDENGNFKPIQFDADRDSTSTRVNKAGLIENVEANIPIVTGKQLIYLCSPIIVRS